MPTYRLVHTKITQSFDFHELPDDFTRLMWVLLPLALDCEGRGIWNPIWIRSKLFPLREDVTNQQMMDALQLFNDKHMVQKYTVDGRDYFYSVKFKDYQKGTHKEADSVLPDPPKPRKKRSVASPELVKSKSGVSPELLKSKSVTDTDSTTDSTTDSDSDSDSTTTTDTKMKKPVVVVDTNKKRKIPESIQRLKAYGILDPKIKELTSLKNNSEIINYCKAYEAAKKAGKANGTGWLVKAITQNWDISELLELDKKNNPTSPGEKYLGDQYAEFIEH